MNYKFKQRMRQFNDPTKLPGWAEYQEHPEFRSKKVQKKVEQKQYPFHISLLELALPKSSVAIGKLFQMFGFKFETKVSYPYFKLTL